jgi:hypothetical protein
MSIGDEEGHFHVSMETRPMRGVIWLEMRNFFVIISFFYLEDIRRINKSERKHPPIEYEEQLNVSGAERERTSCVNSGILTCTARWFLSRGASFRCE